MCLGAQIDWNLVTDSRGRKLRIWLLKLVTQDRIRLLEAVWPIQGINYFDGLLNLERGVRRAQIHLHSVFYAEAVSLLISVETAAG